jgi:hypothetical protein
MVKKRLTLLVWRSFALPSRTRPRFVQWLLLPRPHTLVLGLVQAAVREANKLRMRRLRGSALLLKSPAAADDGECVFVCAVVLTHTPLDSRCAAVEVKASAPAVAVAVDEPVDEPQLDVDVDEPAAKRHKPSDASDEDEKKESFEVVVGEAVAAAAVDEEHIERESEPIADEQQHHESDPVHDEQERDASPLPAPHEAELVDTDSSSSAAPAQDTDAAPAHGLLLVFFDVCVLAQQCICADEKESEKQKDDSLGLVISELDSRRPRVRRPRTIRALPSAFTSLSMDVDQGQDAEDSDEPVRFVQSLDSALLTVAIASPYACFRRRRCRVRSSPRC